MDFLNDRVITLRLVETYLTGTKDKRNNLAMLKVLCPDLVEGFRFPKVKVRVKILPSKSDMKAFCNALPSDMYRLHFLLLVTSGLRVEELMKGEIDRSNRMILPKMHDGQTKGTWVSFYNSEAEKLLNMTTFNPVSTDTLSHVFKKTAKKTGIQIYPHLLRSIFAREMSLKGVQDRYIDAFCGRTPQSVLARHYSDFSHEVLKEIYEKSRIKVLS